VRGIIAKTAGDRQVRTAQEALRNIFDRPCGQQLKPLILEKGDRLRQQKELKVDDQTVGPST